MNYLTATITPTPGTATNYAGTKELVNSMCIVASVGGKLKTVVDARFYMARKSNAASPVYCSVWIDGNSTHFSGSGKASGYGYHKESVALQAALDSAGVSLFGDVYGRERKTTLADIGGVGESAMRAALLAVAVAVGADITQHIFI